MSSYVKLHPSEATLLLIFVVSFVWLMVATTLLPKDIGISFGVGGYFGIILFGVLFMELYCREMANPYPYYQMIVRPTNNVLNLFALPDRTRKYELGREQAAFIPLAYKTEVPFLDATGTQTYVSTDKILIHYSGEWTSHVHSRPGTGTYRGYNVPHPATEIIEVKQLEHSPFSLEFSEPVPVFQLIMGSQDMVPDVDIENVDTKVLTLLGKNIEVKDLKAILLKNASLESQIQVSQSRANEWQQKCYALAHENSQQRNDINALKQAVTAAKGLALEILLTMIEACHSLDKAARMLRGRTWGDWLTKYVVALVGLAMLLLFLYFDPQVVSGILATLNNPLVDIVLGFVAVVIVIILLRQMRKK